MVISALSYVPDSAMYPLFTQIELTQKDHDVLKKDDCSICQELLDATTLTCTSCNRSFCRHCLEGWFLTKQPCQCPHRCKLTLRDDVDSTSLTDKERQILALHQGNASCKLRQAIEDLLCHQLLPNTSMQTLLELDASINEMFEDIVHDMLFKLRHQHPVFFQLNYDVPQRFSIPFEEGDERWVVDQWYRAPERNFRRGQVPRHEDMAWLALRLRDRLLRRVRDSVSSRRDNWSLPESGR